MRVVGDRTQFCFGALLLLYCLEYAPVSTTGGPGGWGVGGGRNLLTGYGQEHGHASMGALAATLRAQRRRGNKTTKNTIAAIKERDFSNRR